MAHARTAISASHDAPGRHRLTPILVTICVVLGCALTYSIHLEQELQKR
jgi:hypothetical protein